MIKINDGTTTFNVPYQSLIYVDGKVYEMDPKISKLIIDDKVDLIKKTNNQGVSKIQENRAF